MKQIYLLILILYSFNILSQCPDAQINWWEMGQDYAFVNGVNDNQVEYYEIEYKAGETFTPGDGTAETFTFSGFPNTVPNLTPGTAYYFTNRTVCYNGSVGTWNDNGNDGPDLWYTDMLPGEFTAENILSHNTSQEITMEPAVMCEEVTSNAAYDFLFQGSSDDNTLSCPETSFTATETGQYIVTLTDAYGDGWIGNSPATATVLNVLVNGSIVLENLSMPDGTSSEEHIISVYAGDEISTQWVYQGTWFWEVGYSIVSQSALDNAETQSIIPGHIYHRSYIPADFGYEGNITIGAVELGIWYSDADGNYNADLPVSSYPGTQYQNIFVYRHTIGGVGTNNVGQDQNEFEQIAFSLNFEISPDDHQTVKTVPLTFLPGFGELNGNGVEVSANDEFVIQVWMSPSTEASTGVAGGVRKFIGGNESEFAISPDVATNYPYPSYQTGVGIDPDTPASCAYYTYAVTNSSLINLVIGSNSELSVNDLDDSEVHIYPNPIDNENQYLNIKTDNYISKSVTVYDLMGRIVYNLFTDSNQIDISSLSAGTYVVEVATDNKTHRSKIVIK